MLKINKLNAKIDSKEILKEFSLNINPGDKVITTPLTFVASANCIRYCGGEVVFVDIDQKTLL